MHKERFLLLKVGIMVVVGLLILSGLIFFSEGLRLRRKGWELTVVFNYVAGLEERAPVRLAGMEIGEVSSIRIKNRKIHVKAWLMEEAKVHEDTKATIESMGLIGEKYLSLTLGSADRPLLRDRAIIQGEDPITLKDVLKRGEMIAKRIEYVTKTIESGTRLLDEEFKEGELFKRVDRILTNIDSITSNLNRLIIEGRGDLSSSLSNLRKSSNEFKEAAIQLRLVTTKFTSILEELERGFTGKGEDIRKIISDLERLTYSLNSTTLSIRNITKHVEQGKGVVGRIIFDEEMAKNLDEAILDLKELAKELRTHPWKLLRKK